MLNQLIRPYILPLVLIFATQAAHAVHAAQVQLVDGDEMPVSDAVLSLIPVNGVVPSLPAGKSVDLNQRAEAFWPKVLPVQTGTDVAFQNQDPTRHHVYSYSPAKQFERPVPANSDPPHVIFDKAGIVALGCNIHDQMLAYIVVVDTPYFAKTDEKGQINLSGLPNGAYKATIWHPRLKAPNNMQVSDVMVEADQIRGLNTKLGLKPERKLSPDAERGAY